jgi:hypothetical protein
LERQYLAFIIVAGVVFGTLIIVGLFFNPMQTQGENPDSNNAIKAKIGQESYIRYSSGVVTQIQNLPSKNNVTVEISSELHNTNLAGLRGEVRYNEMIISYVQNGKYEAVRDDVFPTIEYRFSPDSENKTSYSYENVRFVADGQNPQLIVSVVPLKAAEVGERYTVKLILDTGGLIKYQITEKVIEIVP